MTTVLCTLYNSLYLDKGLVLYDSLCESAKDFKLYVLCMDDKCYEVLTDLKQNHHIPIKLSDFEEGDDALLEAKSNRSTGEYCWTCSSSFIRYILKHFGEENCTYIDADMYFYSDPQILLDEMASAGKSVMVVPHRFPEDRKDEAKIVGEYCVEFNTFKNNAEAFEVLEYWRNRCLECCSNLGDGIHWGDQKYLEELVDKFDCVHVCQNNGSGLAPWNVVDYRHRGQSVVDITYLPLNVNCSLIFWHFQSVKYISRRLVRTTLYRNVKGMDYKWVKSMYKDYLLKIDNKKSLIKNKYGIDILIKSHPSRKQIKETKSAYFLNYFNALKLYIRAKELILYI